MKTRRPNEIGGRYPRTHSANRKFIDDLVEVVEAVNHLSTSLKKDRIDLELLVYSTKSFALWRYSLTHSPCARAEASMIPSDHAQNSAEMSANDAI